MVERERERERERRGEREREREREREAFSWLLDYISFALPNGGTKKVEQDGDRKTEDNWLVPWH